MLEEEMRDPGIVGDEIIIAIPEPGEMSEEASDEYVTFMLNIAVMGLNSQEDYNHARELVKDLSEKVGDDKDHPLNQATLHLERLIEKYEEDHWEI